MQYSIRVQELKKRLDNGDDIVLLDVREAWEHSMANIEGSVLISLGELPQSIDRLDQDAEIVCYCHHGDAQRGRDGVSSSARVFQREEPRRRH